MLVRLARAVVSSALEAAAIDQSFRASLQAWESLTLRLPESDAVLASSQRKVGRAKLLRKAADWVMP